MKLFAFGWLKAAIIGSNLPGTFGVTLKEQFSAWAPETMINQFKEAVAAKPACIEIMGHPGATAFHDIVKSASDAPPACAGPMSVAGVQLGSWRRGRSSRARAAELVG